MGDSDVDDLTGDERSALALTLGSEFKAGRLYVAVDSSLGVPRAGTTRVGEAAAPNPPSDSGGTLGNCAGEGGASERSCGNTSGGGGSDGGLLGMYDAMPGLAAAGPAFTCIGDTGLDAIRAWPSGRCDAPAFALALRCVTSGLLEGCTVVLAELAELAELLWLVELVELEALPAPWPERVEDGAPASQLDTITLNIELVRARFGGRVD